MRVVRAALLCALCAAPAAARTTGSITGSAADASGAPLPGVVVTAAGPGGAVEQVTGPDGAFTFPDLPPGDYVVTAALPGFETAQAAASVAAGGVAAVAVVLEIARLLETVSVIAAAPSVYAANVVAAPMLEQQAGITSVMAVVDNLPGVSVQEGDAYGFDDWSNNVAVRGFQVNLNEAQIGTTIDGLPNGTSDFWGGSKANRFVDAANLGGVDVSQGTADIASRSVEALGGTFNFVTDDPARERTWTVAATLGEHGGRRYHVRVDTGPLFGGGTYAWVSAARQEAEDWVQRVALNERDHLAGKLVSSHGRLDLTSYVSYDDVREITYQRIYSDADYRANPRWDRLSAHWTGVPYLDQFHRPGWTTDRRNAFAYLKADWALSDAAALSAGGYHHRMSGYGGWLPPFIVDVTDDAGGPESELADGPTVRGGEVLGEIRFVDGGRAAVGPRPGCASSYVFNVYGPGGPEVDPACHPGASPVMSHRRADYLRNRSGLTLDHEWFGALGALGSRLRSGVWYERSSRAISRDWRRVLDPRIGVEHSDHAYWRQYDQDFPQRVFKWYVEETLYAGPLAFSGGVKQFLAGIERHDRFGVEPRLAVDSDSKALVSGGVTYETPLAGLEAFGGYAQNFKALSDRLLELPGRSVDAPRAGDRRQPRRRRALYGPPRAPGSDLVRHRFPEPDLLSRPGDGGRARLPRPRRRRLLQRGRARHAGRGAVRRGGAARPDGAVHRLHLQRLAVPRRRRPAGGRGAEHRTGQRRPRRAGAAVGGVARPDRPARPGRLRQVHLRAAGQPRDRLVRRRLVAGGRLPPLRPRAGERPPPRRGGVARGEQPARPDVPVHHRRELCLARGAPHDLDERVGVVLIRLRCTAPCGAGGTP